MKKLNQRAKLVKSSAGRSTIKVGKHHDHQEEPAIMRDGVKHAIDREGNIIPPWEPGALREPVSVHMHADIHDTEEIDVHEIEDVDVNETAEPEDMKKSVRQTLSEEEKDDLARRPKAARTPGKGGEQEQTLTAEERKLKSTDRISPELEEVKRTLEEQIGLHKCFDVVFREMVFGGTRTGLFYLNGFAKDFVLVDVLERLSYAEHTNKSDETFTLFMDMLIPHIQVTAVEKMTEVVQRVSRGEAAFFFEGETRAITIDAKTYPVRSTEEPDLERVVRGSRDGFVETLLTNVTLIRRRIRDPRIMFEMMEAGKRSQTDICIAYIQDIADPHLVEAIRDKIKMVKADGFPLAEKQLEESIVSKGWNPYPVVRYTERPDVAAVHLLEGHICVMVDTSPSVMVLPTTFFHHVQHAEEFRQTPMIGTYLRWVRYLGIIASIFLLPIWYLIATEPALKPAGLSFLGPEKTGHLPLLVQFLIAEIGTDLMRMAAVHTPSPLATAMGLVAAILVGEIAVKTGLFVNEVILYLAVVAIGTFATPSYELSLANRFTRLLLLIATAAFQVPGFIIGSTLWVIILSLQRSYNAPYMWPFIPFNAKAMLDIIVRRPFSAMTTRLSLTKPLDGTRQPKRK